MGTSVTAAGDTQPAHAGIITLLVAGTMFMENLDGTVITPALPQIARSFGVGAVDLNSGVSAYMLALGVFLPASGWVAERLGARKVYAAAIALFTVTSLLCGVSQTLPQFVGLRILQGMAGALMVPVGRFVVLRVTPKERLIQAIGTLTWPALIAPVLGPPLGGLLTDILDWRWIFYLNIPLGLLAVIAAWTLMPDTRSTSDTPFDWPGFVLSGGALFSLLYVSELLTRTAIPWREVAILAILGLAATLATIRHLRRAAHPLFDFSALKIPTFAATLRGGSLFRLSVNAVPFLLPLMFQFGFGYSAFAAGAMLMATFGGNLAMKMFTSPILRRFGFRSVLITAGLLNVATVAACAAIDRAMPVPVICAILFAGGMTRSMNFTAFNTLAFADVPQSGMAAANTLFSTGFQVAMGLGVVAGASAWRIGSALAPAGTSAMLPFRIAFLLIAAIALISVWSSTRLDPGAGESVSKRRKASA